MNAFATTFLVINAAALFLMPRHWSPLPLLVGTCYMTLGQGIALGPFHFTMIRLLILVGVVRVLTRGERPGGGGNSLDRFVLYWSLWALASSAFHHDPTAALVFRLGFVYNTCGVYFLLRCFCQSRDDLVMLLRIVAIVLVPLAAEMIYEQVAASNLFSILGGVPESPDIRRGNLRAQGPFAHAILAGTVGAVCLPMMIGLWQRSRKRSLAGIIAGMVMIFTCSSSGPILSALAGIGAIFMWRFRTRMRFVRYCCVFGYIALDLVMKAPAYFLIARIDLAGGSTGWHRARLIQSAFSHLNEWWLGGTDYTRHWMPTGVSWSPNHADITNHYIQMGVIGGLPLMILFIAVMWKGFSLVGQTLRRTDDGQSDIRFMVWALGASLFSIAATCISVSFFDQSFLFLYLVLAAIGSIRNTVVDADGMKP